MKAMQLQRLGVIATGSTPLQRVELPEPRPGAGEVLIQVHACGVCHTELDEIEGRTPPPLLPVILGHQVVGRVVEIGSGVSKHAAVGERVGMQGDCAMLGNLA
jgi:propanol-preferring alcohol dehydrogenase